MWVVSPHNSLKNSLGAPCLQATASNARHPPTLGPERRSRAASAAAAPHRPAKRALSLTPMPWSSSTRAVAAGAFQRPILH